MNNYTLTFTSDTPDALFQNIRQFCALLDSGSAPAPDKSETVIVNAPAPAYSPIPPQQSPAIPAQPVAPTSTQPPVPPVSQPIPTAAAPAYTLEQLGRATCVLSDANRMQEIQELFGSFGITALTELPPNMYGAYATALRQKGVTI